MYNRYIPQPDGSYRRSRMPEPSPAPPRPMPPPVPEPPKPNPCIPECAHLPPPAPPRPNRRPQRPPCPPPPRQESCQGIGLGQFFRGLLPKDFDTSDLLIVLLLLLMAGDCQEDQNTALLTLVLYLFL